MCLFIALISGYTPLSSVARYSKHTAVHHSPRARPATALRPIDDERRLTFRSAEPATATGLSLRAASSSDMVVEYRSGGEGSATSCCSVVPCVLGQCYGSVVPHVMPQVLLVIGIAVLSRWWNPLRIVESWGGGGSGNEIDPDDPDLAQAMQVIGILLAFLMVFKTQSAYGQFWEASNRIENLLQVRSCAALPASFFAPFYTRKPNICQDRLVR